MPEVQRGKKGKAEVSTRHQFSTQSLASSLTMEAGQKRVTQDSRASEGAERRLNPRFPKEVPFS